LAIRLNVPMRLWLLHRKAVNERGPVHNCRGLFAMKIGVRVGRQNVQLHTGEFTARPRSGLFDIHPRRLPIDEDILVFLGAILFDHVSGNIVQRLPGGLASARHLARVTRGVLLDNIIGESFAERKGCFPSLIDERVPGLRRSLWRPVTRGRRSVGRRVRLWWRGHSRCAVGGVGFKARPCIGSVRVCRGHAGTGRASAPQLRRARVVCILRSRRRGRARYSRRRCGGISRIDLRTRRAVRTAGRPVQPRAVGVVVAN